MISQKDKIVNFFG